MDTTDALLQLTAGAVLPLAVGVYVGRRAGDKKLARRVATLCGPIVCTGWLVELVLFQAALPGSGPTGLALRLHQMLPGLGLPELGQVLRVPVSALWLTAFTALVAQRYAQSLAIQVGEWPGDPGALFWPAVMASVTGLTAGLLLLLMLWVVWVSLGHWLP